MVVMHLPPFFFPGYFKRGFLTANGRRRICWPGYLGFRPRNSCDVRMVRHSGRLQLGDLWMWKVPHGYSVIMNTDACPLSDSGNSSN